MGKAAAAVKPTCEACESCSAGASRLPYGPCKACGSYSACKNKPYSLSRPASRHGERHGSHGCGGLSFAEHTQCGGGSE